MKKIIIILLSLLLVSCMQNINNTLEKEKTFLGYINDSNNDMVLLLNTEVYLTTVNKELKESLIKDATNLISKYHILLDSHHYYKDSNNNTITNLKVLNDSINKAPIEVDPIIIDALKESIELSKLTKGYFNITLGNLSNLYKDKFLPYDSINTDPTKADIEQALSCVMDINEIDKYIIIDDSNNTVEMKSLDKPYSIDLGAFTKGYIIDKVYKELIKYNTSFLLNAGASSIVSYSNKEENISWNVGISNPEKPSNQLLSFSFNNGALSTSGDYENYYLLEDKTRRHHILNPFTGYSENYYKSITLISDNAGIIDALSTALFNIENESEFKEILHSAENYYSTDISFLYIKDGLYIFTDNTFNDYIVTSSNSYSSIIIED